MSEQLPERLAQRRQELKQRQMRQRRIALASCAFLAAAVGLAYFLVAGQGDQADTTVTSAQQASSDKGRGASSPPAAGAQPDSSWKQSTAPVPVLMYHVIGEPAGAVPYPDLYLSAADFRDQVEWLDQNSYTPVTLVQVQEAWYDGGKLPPKPVVLSFDDGYLGQYLYAMPILRKKGWAGQLNLKAEGSDLSSKQVKKMIAAGWEIASHTITHPDLTVISADQVETELVDSKRMLERDLGVEIVNFCYPAGEYNADVAAAVEAAGYRGATTVEPGLARREDPFELKRLRINLGDGATELAALLEA